MAPLHENKLDNNDYVRKLENERLIVKHESAKNKGFKDTMISVKLTTMVKSYYGSSS